MDVKNVVSRLILQTFVSEYYISKRVENSVDIMLTFLYAMELSEIDMISYLLMRTSRMFRVHRYECDREANQSI